MKMKNLTQRITGSLTVLTALITMTPNASHAAAFTAGDLVVERIDGTTSAAQLVNVVEYDTSGTSKQTIAMPNAATRPSANPYNLMDGATSTSAGGLSRSANAAMIVLPGYNGIPGDTAIASSSTATILRTIGAVNIGGTVDTSRAISIASGTAFRGVASTDGTQFWCTGGNGLWCYLDSGSTVNQLASQNLREARVFNNKLYVSTGSASGTPGIGIHSVAVGADNLPTSGSATYTQVISDGGTSPSPYNFEFNPAMTVCYVTDDRSIANGGGIQKYTNNGTAWSLAYTFGTGTASTVGAFGLAVDWSGANPVIYATTTESASTGNRVITVTDTGSGSTVSTLVAATAGQWFRGIAFAPVNSVAIDNTGTPASGSVVKAANNVPVFGFRLTPVGGSVDFTALKLTASGTATSSDLSNFRVVYDADNSGTYNAGDTVVSGSASLGNPISFSISGQTGLSGPRRYLVIANVAGGATVGHIFTGSIAAATDVTASLLPVGSAAGNEQTVAAAAFDLTMSTVVSSESATISSLVNDATIPSTSQGVQVWKVTFANPAGNAGAGTISAINFTQGENNGVLHWQSTIQAAELFDGTTALGAGTISDTSIAFSGLSISVADNTSKTLTLRISLKSTPGALPDNIGYQFAIAADDVTVSGNGVTTASISSDQSQNLISVVATRLVFSIVPTYVIFNTMFSATVQAQDANGNRDRDNVSLVDITLTSGSGILSGNDTLPLVSGLLAWPHLSYDTVGTFTITADDHSLTPATATITARPVATVADVFMPQYIQGIASGTSNGKRVPFACRLSLANLAPNATYRYYNQCVSSSGDTSSAGNVIFASASGDFVRTTNPGLGTAGNYGTFTTDASGAYTGWFVNEPTGNARFLAGSSVYVQIVLNDGADGTTTLSRLTTPDSATALAFAATADPNTGTGIRGNSYATDKNFVLLYDNAAGSGRSLAATFVESDGVAEDTAANYVLFYNDSVDGISGAWGTIIPNNNANGVQRIEQRKLSDGTLVLANTDSDGIWPSGANTVNPTGSDTNSIVITASDAPLGVTVPHITQIRVTGGSVLIDFTGGTSDTITAFTVLSSANLRASLTPIAATITTSGPGQFRATVPAVTTAAFYRIKR